MRPRGELDTVAAEELMGSTVDLRAKRRDGCAVGQAMRNDPERGSGRS
jgi:hypothetical protein